MMSNVHKLVNSSILISTSPLRPHKLSILWHRMALCSLKVSKKSSMMLKWNAGVNKRRLDFHLVPAEWLNWLKWYFNRSVQDDHLSLLIGPDRANREKDCIRGLYQLIADYSQSSSEQIEWKLSSGLKDETLFTSISSGDEIITVKVGIRKNR